MNADTTGAIDVADRTRIDWEEARGIAVGAYDRLLELLDTLEPGDWSRQTDCDAWDVADMVRHLVGAAKGHAKLRELGRQLLWGRRHADEYGGNDLDAMNDLQVRDHAELGPDELVAELRAVAPRAVAKRMKTPRPVRGVALSISDDGSTGYEGCPSTVTLGDLNRIVLTRDVFLHRIDIARAVGRPTPVDPAIDARIVEDIVLDWAERHASPFDLTLTGPAGGRYVAGPGDARWSATLDAFEFCRVLSGRAPGEGLLRTGVLF